MSMEAGNEESSDNIGPVLRRMQYDIEGHMDDAPEFIRWGYSEPGLPDDLIVGQIDIQTLTPDSLYRMKVITWLGPDVFDQGAASVYGVYDMDTGPIIAWRDDTKTPEGLQFFTAETAERTEYTMTYEQLQEIANLVQRGTPVEDALAENDDSIHRKPPARSWLWAALEAYGFMNPYYHVTKPSDEQEPDS